MCGRWLLVRRQQRRRAGATGSRTHMSARLSNDGTPQMDESVDLDTGNRWSAYKRLYKVISSVINGGSVGETGELESVLRKHKPDFISLLKNPVSFPISCCGPFPDIVPDISSVCSPVVHCTRE